jgi:hypothetical protein
MQNVYRWQGDFLPSTSSLLFSLNKQTACGLSELEKNVVFDDTSCTIVSFYSCSIVVWISTVSALEVILDNVFFLTCYNTVTNSAFCSDISSEMDYFHLKRQKSERKKLEHFLNFPLTPKHWSSQVNSWYQLSPASLLHMLKHSYFTESN